VGSTDTEDLCMNTGHIGIYVSSKCQKEFAPKILKWLKAREPEETAEPPARRSGRKTKTADTPRPAKASTRSSGGRPQPAKTRSAARKSSR